MEPNCDNCKNKRICRYYPYGSVVNMDLPGWEIKDELNKYMKALLPQWCERYEAVMLYPDRDNLGRLINRKPLKLWYPDQKPKEEYGTYYRICSPSCQCRYCQNEKIMAENKVK